MMRLTRRWGIALLFWGIAFLPLVRSAQAQLSFTTFPTPTAGSQPFGITSGPDGNLWFAEINANNVGRITIAGVVTEFPVPTGESRPYGITSGPDGNPWFTEVYGNNIGRITTAGVVTEFPVPTSESYPYDITGGPDGNLWFTEYFGGKIGRITPAGVITEFPLPTYGLPNWITSGPDGNLWFVETGGTNIGRITTAGVITEFPIPTGSSQPYAITSGPDGNLWFVEYAGNKIGRITTSGAITEFTIPTSGAFPVGITSGPDGNLWFTELLGNNLGQITTAGVITEFPFGGGYQITTGSDGNLWVTTGNIVRVQITSPAIQSPACSANNPALISGSTGAQGVIDPTNQDPTQGLVWPSNAASMGIEFGTGRALFFDSSNNLITSTSLPGIAAPFPGGPLNFINVHVQSGKTLEFSVNPLVSGASLPALILSCQDVIVDQGAAITWAGTNQGLAPGAFLGGGAWSAAGFGPRIGSLPAAGSLYPSVGGSGGFGGAASTGGGGGPAFVIAAAQSVTVNGSIRAGAAGGQAGSTLSQGGAGGSVRLAGILVQGAGMIDTSAGADSDGVIRSPAGPVEIQAFVQDLFSGTIMQNGVQAPTPIRGSAPVVPIPANLPAIYVSQVNYQYVFGTIGSLISPDVTLPAPSSATVGVGIDIYTQYVPAGTLLNVLAVGTDGSSISSSGNSVTLCSGDCSPESGYAYAYLNLNAGATYQIVVTPSAAFQSSGDYYPPTAAPKAPRIATLGSKLPNERRDIDSVADRWMKQFGVRPEIAGASAKSDRAELIRAPR